MSIVDFINALEQRRAVPASMAKQLRAKVESEGHRITPDAMLRYLVKKAVITPQQSEELSAALLSVLAPEPEVLFLAPLPEDEGEGDEELAVAWMEEDAPSPAPPVAPPVVSPPPAPRKRTDDEAFFAERDATGPGLALPDARADVRTAAGMYRLSGGGKIKGKKRTAAGKSQWDSPLLLLGGGALVVLVVAGAFLYYLLFRESADAVLADANKLFESGAYSQAITRYEEFINGYSSHKDVSQARVRLAMTRLWQAVESMGDPGAALETAKQTIAEIEGEPAFISDDGGEEGLSAAKQELSALLVRIARALVDDADKETDPDAIQRRIEQVDAALALSANAKYVPEKFRNGPELASIAETLAVVRTRQQRDARLAASLRKMDEAIAAGDTATAFAERQTLLADYPALADDERLAAKVRDVSAAEQAQVKFVAGATKALTAWPQRAVVAELALAERRAAPPSSAATDAATVVRVDGALYGLRTADGALLWRRFAGFGQAGAPLLLDGGRDVVAADLHGGELWRLEAATGKLVWRLPINEQITGVVAAGSRLLATSAAGALVVVDAANGAVVGRVEFAQPIRTAPAVSERGDRAYVVAEHSILYTISVDDFSCLGVYYLGHAADAIVAPPVVVLNKVIVADNSDADACRVRVLALDDDGAVAGEAASERLAGVVLTPLAVAARRLGVATTRNVAAVFEVGAAADSSALTVVARREATANAPLARFVFLADGRLWIAADQLTKFTILPTDNRLAVESLDHDYHGDAFDAPLIASGTLLIHVRRPAGGAGAIVGAMDSTANLAKWETELAVPVAGMPAIDAARRRVTTATASGAAYLVDGEAMVRGVHDAPVRPPSSVEREDGPLTTAVDLGEGRLAAGGEGNLRLLLVRPDEPRQAATFAALGGPLSCPLVGWHGGVVAATDVGQVFLIDGATGKQAATPFQPKLAPDRKYRWLTPAVAGEGDASQLVVSDGAERLHLVQWQDEPTPHLEAVASADVGPSPLSSRLAVVGSTVFAGTESGGLASFALPQLTRGKTLDVGGRVLWGPFAASDGLLFATDAGDLMLVGDAGDVRWRRPLNHGDLAGAPLFVEGSALMLHAAGVLTRVNLSDGAETAAVELGQPAVAGPAPLGQRLIVVAPDGALLIVNRP